MDEHEKHCKATVKAELLIDEALEANGNEYPAALRSIAYRLAVYEVEKAEALQNGGANV